MEREAQDAGAQYADLARELEELEGREAELISQHHQRMETLRTQSEQRIAELVKHQDEQRRVFKRIERQNRRLKSMKEAANPAMSLHRALSEFGTMYHDHSKELSSLMQTLQATVDYLGDDPLAMDSSPERLRAVLDPLVERLRSALHGLLAALEARRETLRLSDLDLRNLGRSYERIARAHERSYSIPSLPFELRQHMIGLGHRLDTIERLLSGLDDEPELRALFKAVRGFGKEVERIACLYRLHDSRSQLAAMEDSTEDLRRRIDAIVFGEADDPSARPTVEVSLLTLVFQGIEQVQAKANHRSIEIRTSVDERADYAMRANPEPLARALRCLLENAVKYSEQTSIDYADTTEPGTAWIDVILAVERDSVVVRIENWGVPIMPREIEDDLIYQDGYRGAYAIRSGRTGTGVGLWYVKQVVEAHDGRIHVSSDPARPDQLAQDKPFDQRFLTKFTLAFPQA